MKHFYPLIITLLMSLPLPAQTLAEGSGWFNHLDASLTAGSTGIGIDVAVPMGDMLQLRAGFQAMPRFSAVVNFPIQGMYKDENGIWSQSDFIRMADMMEGFTGFRAKDNVDMRCKPTFYNAKLMVDVFPFRDKRWHVTAGFYWGTKQLGEALNVMNDMTSLFAVNMYNAFYTKFESDYYLDHAIYSGVFLDPDVAEKMKGMFRQYGRMGVYVGEFARNVELLYYESDVMDWMGNIVHHQGEPVLDADGNQMYRHYKGDPYLMEPDENSTVSATVKSNAFKPYLGFGYGTDMNRTKSGWGVSFDAGVQFWGGSPSVIAHDGIDLVNDLTNVQGKVGTYSRFIGKMKAYPVVELRITKRLF